MAAPGRVLGLTPRDDAATLLTGGRPTGFLANKLPDDLVLLSLGAGACLAVVVVERFERLDDEQCLFKAGGALLSVRCLLPTLID